MIVVIADKVSWQFCENFETILLAVLSIPSWSMVLLSVCRPNYSGTLLAMHNNSVIVPCKCPRQTCYAWCKVTLRDTFKLMQVSR